MVTNAQDRELLIREGLPIHNIPDFCATSSPCLLAPDSDYVLLGRLENCRCTVYLDNQSRAVVGNSPSSDEMFLINSTLKSFLDSLNLVQSAFPYSQEDADLDELDEVAGKLKDALQEIDPPALVDLDGFWWSFSWDVSCGDYIMPG